jgi:uncharacterized protein
MNQNKKEGSGMHRDEIIQTLQEYKIKHAGTYGVVSMGVFGSIAKGTDTEESDIDICIESETPNPFHIAHIKMDLEELFAKKVDIVRMRQSMNPFLRKRIESEVIYV